MLVRACIGCFCCLLPLLGAAQDGGWQVEIERQLGSLLPVEPFLRGENLAGRPLSACGATELTVLRGIDPARPWAGSFGGAATGFGVTFLHLDSPAELGRPVAVHRSFRAPLLRVGSLRIGYGADIGLAGGWRRYDAGSNPYNKLISTRLTAYVRLALATQWRLSPRLTLYGNAGLSHVSNGNYRRPNAGLNAATAGLGLRRTWPASPTAPAAVRQTFERGNRVTLSLLGATEKRLYFTDRLAPAEKYRGITYGIGGVNLAWERRVSARSRVGAGIGAVYHPAARTAVTLTDNRLVRHPDGSTWRGLQFGVYPSYELIFHRWSVVVRAEYRLTRPGGSDPGGRFRQRLGLQYRLSDRWFLATLVNARQFSIADFVEWHAGYVLTRSRPRPK